MLRLDENKIPILTNALSTLGSSQLFKGSSEVGMAIASLIANRAFDRLEDLMKAEISEGISGSASLKELRQSFDFGTVADVEEFYESFAEGNASPWLMTQLIYRRLNHRFPNETMEIIEAAALQYGQFQLLGMAKITLSHDAELTKTPTPGEPASDDQQPNIAVQTVGRLEAQAICRTIQPEAIVWFDKNGHAHLTTFMITMARHYPAFLGVIVCDHWKRTAPATRCALNLIKVELEKLTNITIPNF